MCGVVLAVGEVAPLLLCSVCVSELDGAEQGGSPSFVLACPSGSGRNRRFSKQVRREVGPVEMVPAKAVNGGDPSSPY